MDLLDRVRGIMVRPREEWEKIKEEPTPLSFLYTSYAGILAGIPACAQFIAYGFIGVRVPLKGWITYGIGMAFFRSILLYILTLVSVYLLGLVIDFLAPSFSSSHNRLAAMKLAVYSMTPVWLGGVFYIAYPLWTLGILVSLYGIYLHYLGLTSGILETPREKAVPYLVVNVAVAVVLLAVTYNLLRLIFAVWTIYRSI
ncbi:MAG: Yip1 family protein [bacterium]